MQPKLNQLVLNGASRHRLRKGFILFKDQPEPLNPAFQPEVAGSSEAMAANCNRFFADQADLRGFRLEVNSRYPALLELITPLLPVYDGATRSAFMQQLAKATGHLLRQAYLSGYRVVAAGVNPYASESTGRSPILCADIHEVEVYDSDELERIYNLYRQFLPELLAVSANAAIYGDKLQPDRSLRMKLNPASFLPRYIDQFSIEHLDRLERMLRKAHGLADLKKMDVNPLGGESLALGQRERPLLEADTATIELRFLDAQSCLPFIRAQIVLLQAIAVYGRTLARRGNRIFPIDDSILDENKAAAIRSGTAALLKPDPKFNRADTRQRHGSWFHHQGVWETASNSLLEIIGGPCLTALQDLDCSVAEIWPLVLGAELRRRGHRAFTNYAEYQVYVYYTSGRHTYPRLQEQIERMLADPMLDPATAYNQQTFPAPAREIERAWQNKLSRQRGWIQAWEKGHGMVCTADQNVYPFSRHHVEGRASLPAETAVTFALVEHDGQCQAQAIRADIRVQRSGWITHYEPGCLYGLILTIDNETFNFLRADLVADRLPSIGEEVAFEIYEVDGPRSWAKQVRRLLPIRLLGRVRQYDQDTGQGYIVQPDGWQIPVQQADLADGDCLVEGQWVTFEMNHREFERRAVRVRARQEKQDHV